MGDNFDPLGADLIIGNDVFMGDGTLDRFLGEGGDDMMIGSPGSETRFIGMSGFDWATFKDDQFGVNIDMTFRAFDETPLPRSSAGIMARFDAGGGPVGLGARATCCAATTPMRRRSPTAGAQGSVLTNIALIAGLQELLDHTAGVGEELVVSTASNRHRHRRPPSPRATSCSAAAAATSSKAAAATTSSTATPGSTSNIGVDLDGDGQPLYLAHDMRDVQADIFAGLIHPGQLSIVREIKYAERALRQLDTAVFTGLVQDYINEVIFLEDGSFLLQVTDTGRGTDGTDILRNIEQVRFADATFAISDNGNFLPDELQLPDDRRRHATVAGRGPAAHGLGGGHRSILNNVSIRLRRHRADHLSCGRSELEPGSGVFTDILAIAGGEEGRVTGETFRPGDEEVGLRLRVRAMYEDEAGVLEEVFSQPTQRGARTSTTRPPAW